MHEQEAKDLCKKYKHRYVMVETMDGQQMDGFVESHDDENVVLAVPDCDNVSMMEAGKQSRQFGYPGYGYPGYGYGSGYPGYGYGYGYPGYGYGYPYGFGYGYPFPRRRFRFRPFRFPFRFLRRMSPLPFY